MTLLWLFGCTSPADEPAFDPALASRIDEATATGAAELGVSAATVAVLLPDGSLHVATAGDVAPDDTFMLGSITKTWVAAAVLLHARAGDLSLDDHVADWLPESPHGDRITVRELLSHTSGLPDYVTDPDIIGALEVAHTPDELIALIADDPLLFDPGTGYFYANTNYVLLGMILQASTGRSWQDIVEDDLAADLPSVSTDAPPDVIGFMNGVDSTGVFAPSIADAAGRMVGDAAGVAAWADRLYGPDLLDPADREQMCVATEVSLDSVEPYGLGCMVVEQDGERFLGHSGSVVGFQSRMRYRESDGTIVVTLVNDFFAEADVIDAKVWQAL